MFIYFTTYLINFINSIFKLHWITQVILIVQLLNLYESYNDVSEYRLLIAHTYNYIYETKSRPCLSFPIMHKDYQVKPYFLR